MEHIDKIIIVLLLSLSLYLCLCGRLFSSQFG